MGISCDAIDAIDVIDAIDAIDVYPAEAEVIGSNKARYYPKFFNRKIYPAAWTGAELQNLKLKSSSLMAAPRCPFYILHSEFYILQFTSGEPISPAAEGARTGYRCGAQLHP